MKIVLIYTAILIIAPLAWMPFSFSSGMDMLWICGTILALGSGYTLREIQNKKSTSSHFDLAMQKLRVTAFITLVFGIFLNGYSLWFLVYGSKGA